MQSHIKEKAPYATYQGMHSLNLVICNSTNITSMLDSCQQAFLLLFFHNSPKRQKFLEEVIISVLAPESKKKKINGLCKTRWVERHYTFSTILDLYPYLVKAWNEICVPSYNKNDDLEILRNMISNTWCDLHQATISTWNFITGSYMC